RLCARKRSIYMGVAEQKPVSQAAIRFLSGPLAEKVISIQKPVTLIGRDKHRDIIVLDPRVSRLHASIRWQNGSWTIENLSPNNFVAINEQQVQQKVLQHISVVYLGKDTSFVFLIQQAINQLSQFPSTGAPA